MLWQLKNTVTNEALSEAGALPKNWGPVFGLEGFTDKLGDLGAWLGDHYADQAWVQVEGELPAGPTAAETNWATAKALLLESDWSMLSDVPMTTEAKADWITYRAALRDIRTSAGFPDSITWPEKPE